MNKHFFITGNSSGIGKEVTENLLLKKNTIVYGISRKNIFSAKNYKHISADFSNTSFIEKVILPDVNIADSVYLINNAGVISEINRVGFLNSESIINDFTVNALAPLLLINKFINSYKSVTGEKVILNISSGAARHTVDAWTTYCSSKAALDMLSLNIAAEQEFFPENLRYKIFSLAPGIVDTKMQDFIRQSDENAFSEKQKFISLKINNKLQSAEKTAEKIVFLLEKMLLKDTISDIRNF